MTARAVQGVSCQVCDKQREPGLIHSRPSKILKGVHLRICTKCESEKKEPREFIIIRARTGENGYKAVSEYIKHRRYEGAAIEASEIV